MPIPDRLQMFIPGGEITPRPTGSNQATTEAHPPPVDQSTPEGLAPSHHLTSNGAPAPPSHSLLTPPNDAKFFDKDLMKQLAVPVGLGVVGLATMTAGIVGLIKNVHQNEQDN
jgi:hypothetical protein